MDQILDRIARGELKEGDKLPPDRELAQLMGVSRATVREGLLALQLLGIVDVQPGEGASVTRASFTGRTLLDKIPELSMEPAELLEARLTVEPVLARALAAAPEEALLRPLRRSIDRTADMATRSDAAQAFPRVGLEFHDLLASLTKNRYLSHFASSLVNVAEHPLWELVNQRIMQQPNDRLAQVTEHTDILRAIEAGNPDQAEAAMRIHLERLRESAFSDEAPPSPAGESSATPQPD